MFDRISETAEKLATNVSRRAFLGRLGRGAAAVAAVAGGMLAFAGKAEANICPRGYVYCFFHCVRPPVRWCG
jgi:hypothetical protein